MVFRFRDLYIGPQASPEKRVVPCDLARRDESNDMGVVSKPYHQYTILQPKNVRGCKEKWDGCIDFG